MDVCRICHRKDGHETFVAREMMFGLRQRFVYFQCAGCGCLQIRDIPADMGPYYPDSYYSMQVRLPSAGVLRRGLSALESTVRRRVSNHLFGGGRRTKIIDWMRRTNTGLSDAILDVGCGRGKLLHELHLFGFRNLTGVDPFVAEELRYDNGIVVHKRELPELAGRFDLIMMHHTFEHVPAPRATLVAAFERLAPGRFLLLRIPVVDCYAWRTYGLDWFSLDAPRHFHLHTRKSLSLLAEQTGFVIERVDYDSGAHQLWGSEQYRRDIPHRSPLSYEENPSGSIFSKAQIRRFERKSRELNARGEGDAACFYLRRP